MKKLNLKMKKGFTLIETLVAISILLIAVVAPLSTIGGSFSSILVARDQMIAVNFAQEGIEMARQKRDSNMLNKWQNGVGSWGDNLPAGDYIVDATNLKGNGFLSACNTSCVASDDKLIHQDQITGLFYQKIGALPAEDTQFTRTVNIVDISVTEKKITSTVTWTIGGTLKKVEVKESIFGII